MKKGVQTNRCSFTYEDNSRYQLREKYNLKLQTNQEALIYTEDLIHTEGILIKVCLLQYKNQSTKDLCK